MAADRGLDAIDKLTEDFHVYPDFHGNRSPIADPTLKGMVSVAFSEKFTIFVIYILQMKNKNVMPSKMIKIISLAVY